MVEKGFAGGVIRVGYNVDHFSLFFKKKSAKDKVFLCNLQPWGMRWDRISAIAFVVTGTNITGYKIPTEKIWQVFIPDRVNREYFFTKEEILRHCS